MDMLQLREKDIFETLKKIKKYEFVIIGGYAVNTYTLPRFSVDCDIVVKESKQLSLITKELTKLGYKKIEDTIETPYKGEFLRYEKTIKENFKSSIDILFRQIVDRQTNTIFDAEWIIENSQIKPLKGKTITEKIKLRIININALAAMKSISCRISDIRDVFMLIRNTDKEKVKEEISKKYDFKDRFEKIKNKITSKEFKDNLQGVYGYIDENTFNLHKKSFLSME